VVPAALALFAGVGATLLLPRQPTLLFMLLVAGAVVAAAWLLRRPPLLAAAFGLLYGWHELGQRLDDRLDPALEGVTLRIEGRVSSIPQRVGEGIRFLLEPQPAPGLPARLELTWYQAPWQPQPAERLLLEVRLRRPRGFANPGGMDFAATMLRNGIGASGYVRSGTRLGRSLADVLQHPVLVARGEIALAVRRALGDRPGTGIVLGLSVGLQDAISPEQWRVLGRSGTSHLMAISGMHIGMVGALGAGLGAAVQRRRQRRGAQRPRRDVAAACAVAAAVSYSLLAGWSVPTQRTAIMIASAALVLLARRLSSGAGVLALALVLVLLIEPLAPLAPGFWLSFGAVALLMLGLGGRLVERGLVAGFLQAQPIVCLGLVPVLVAAFGNVSLVSVLVNLVAIPLYTLLLVPLILVGCATLPWPAVGGGLLRLAASLVESSWPLLQRPAEWPLASWGVASLPTVVWLCIVAGTLAALLPLPRVTRLAGVLMIAGACLWRPPPLAPGEIRFALLDVGQGLSVVLETSQHALVYDTGPAFRSGSDAAALALLPYLRHRGLRRLDALVLSHDDADHTGGASTVLAQLPVDMVYASGPVSGIQGPTRPCDDPWGFTWDGVAFEWLLRDKSQAAADNDRSCVLVVRSGRRTILLAGDIERDAEARLLEEGWQGPVDIVVAPHHGSRSSSSAAFVVAARAGWVLFATGYRNRWGFPAPEVAERWRRSGAASADTASGGAVEFLLRPEREPDPPRLWRIEHPRPWRDP